MNVQKTLENLEELLQKHSRAIKLAREFTSADKVGAFAVVYSRSYFHVPVLLNKGTDPASGHQQGAHPHLGRQANLQTDHGECRRPAP